MSFTLAPVLRAQPTLSRSAVAQKKLSCLLALSIFMSHVRRLLIEAANLLFNYDWVFRLVGSFNKRIGLIQSVFLCYPATEDYTRYYLYQSRARAARWRPSIIGVMWLNGRIGIKFAITANNGDFTEPGNKDFLVGLVDRMEAIRLLLGACHKTFAGILPGVLFAKRIVRETPEADVTVDIVCKAIVEVSRRDHLSAETPVIVLGGKGFIGRKIVANLHGRQVFVVDLANGKDVWPSHLRGRPVLLVNVTLKSAIEDYVPLLWPQAVILNEVYPEPSVELAEKIKEAGCSCYHIAGVRARAFPPFPGGYYGGIPCCATWQSEGAKVLLLKIV